MTIRKAVASRIMITRMMTMMPASYVSDAAVPPSVAHDGNFC